MKSVITLFFVVLTILSYSQEDSTLIDNSQESISHNVTIVTEGNKVRITWSGGELLASKNGDIGYSEIEDELRGELTEEELNATMVEVEKQLAELENAPGIIEEGTTFEDHYSEEEMDFNYTYDNFNRTRWLVFSVGINSYLNASGSTNLIDNEEPYELNHGRSWYWALNLFEHRFALIEDHFGIVIGAGFNWNNYTFKRSTTVFSNNDSTWATVDTNRTFKKNKLKVDYINFPVMFEYTSSSKKTNAFYLAAGVIGGLRIKSQMRQEYSELGQDYYVDVRQHYNITQFKFQGAVRVGFGGVVAFANYNFTPLFENGKGVELYPLEVGITFIGL